MLIGLALRLAAGEAKAATLQVGPGRAYAKPSMAAAAARSGDVIEIDAGLYPGDVAVWTAHNLTLRGVGGRAHLRADGKNAQGKAIWVIAGTNTTVENVEFSGAAVPDRNGAGIRQEGSGLIVRNCYFHDNEDGILTGAGAQSEILIENSEFAYNGHGDGQSHNMYIGNVGKFTLRYCYTHHAKIGHTIKTRARENYILCNRIMDETDGTASYEIDIPNGGLTYMIGNLIQQGPRTENSTIITYAEEGGTNPTQELFVAHNTIVNDRSGGTMIRVAGSAPHTSALIINNLFVGPGTLLNGVGTMTNNMALDGTQLMSRAGFDYRLVPGSAAIDAGVNPGIAEGFHLTPTSQYVHPAGKEPRTVAGAPDLGAYEWSDRGGKRVEARAAAPTGPRH